MGEIDEFLENDLTYQMTREIEAAIEGDWTGIDHSKYLPTLDRLLSQARTEWEKSYKQELLEKINKMPIYNTSVKTFKETILSLIEKDKV